jgi:uncharacterized membrane protein
MLPPAIPPPLQPQQLESKLGLNWLNRVAVITLIFGAIFAFKYAVDNEWLGPGARVAIGVVAALASLVCGDILWKRGHKVSRRGSPDSAFRCCISPSGRASDCITCSRKPPAFLLMVVTTAASAVFAVRYDSQAIAVLGLLGAYITPVSLSTGEDHPWILFSYTFLVNLGGLAAARYRRWKIAEWVAFAATVILYLGWAAAWLKIDNRPVATVFLIAFYAQFASAQTRAVWWVAQLPRCGRRSDLGRISARPDHRVCDRARRSGRGRPPSMARSTALDIAVLLARLRLGDQFQTAR